MKNLKEYRKECEKHILSIHGIDLSRHGIDEESLEDAMNQGVCPIDVAIEFDPENCFDDE